MGVGSVMLAVSNHDDGGAFVVEARKQFHHVVTVLGVEITRRFIG